MKNEEFIKKLDSLLELNHMTYSDLAKEIGIRPSTISMWKNGSSSPRMDALNKIAELFDVSTGDLLKLTSDDATKSLKAVICKAKDIRESIANDDTITQNEKKFRLEFWDEEIENMKYLLDNEARESKNRLSVNLKKDAVSHSMQEEKILSDFRELNNYGKMEAIKRVEELTEIKKYRRDNEESDQQP